MHYPPELSELDKLQGVDTIAIDLETYDPNLKTLGSGAIISGYYKDKDTYGKVTGIAIAFKDKKFYFPIRHVGQRPYAPNHVWKKLNQTIFQNKNITKVFHNAMYDVCWIRQESGLMVQGPIVDTMIAASVINENRMRYSLDSLAKDYLKETKYKSLQEKVDDHLGIPDAISNMHKLPYEFVKDYAEQDVNLTLKLWEIFKKKIDEPIEIKLVENGKVITKVKTLRNIFNLEMDLFPCLVDMRFKGVRVDTSKAETLGEDLEKRMKSILNGIQRRTDISVEVWAASSIQKILDHQNITDYKKTPKSGQASLSKNYLESHPNIYLRLIARVRAYDKLINVFVEGLLKFVHKGRIHAEINQIRSDKGGTVTGRFSMSKPNLQQIPSKGKYGKIIRSFFLPEEGQEWGSFDYSQQEPRLVVHYSLKNNFKNNPAANVSAKALADAYRKDANTDFHKKVAKMAKITRLQAKTINLGMFYGMGKNKLAASLELDPQESKELFNNYHKEVPFVKALSNGLMKFAEDQGAIYTLEDRFCRFDKWEPINKDWNDDKKVFEYTEYVETKSDDGEITKELKSGPVPIMTTEVAKNHYLANRVKSLEEDSDPDCKRFKESYKPAFTYKALNKLIQGSAADMTKKAMVKLYKKGIIPHIQIHDELCLSIDSKEKAKTVEKTMEFAITLLIPNKVNYKIGSNWGNIKEDKKDLT